MWGGNLVFLVFLASGLDEVLATQVRLSGRRFNCPDITLKNGKVRRRQRGRFVKFTCNSGYLLAGERFSTCQSNMWDPPAPKCVRPTCINKVQPPNKGLIYPSHSGAALHFFCIAGYELKGPTDVYCDGQTWDNHAPICLPSKTKPKLSCAFEEDDLCGWTHDLNHDFDWKMQNYKTPSGAIGTGPSFDHTKGPGKDGYYMYIESSSRNENDTAKLISPLYDPTHTETCLEFFYHMFGATIGTLRVYLKKSSESWDLNPNFAIFSKSGNQGDKWYRSYLSLGVVDEEYQIIIEGVRGSSYVSDIAIDDVSIIENCTYDDHVFMTSTTDIPYSTETPLTVESCDNRCGLKAFGNETHQLTCDCDEDCYYNNRCCPDYFDFCLQDSTTEELNSSTDMPNDINPIQSHTKRAFISTVVTTTTAANTVKNTVTTISASTRPKTFRPEFTMPKPTTWQSKVIVTKNISRLTTLPWLHRRTASTSKPTVRILTPPTTPVIVRKVPPTIKSSPTTSRIVFVKPNIPHVIPKQRKYDSIFTTSPVRDEDVSMFSKEDNWSDEVENHADSPAIKRLSESDKLLSGNKPENTHHHIVLAVISVTGVTVLLVVITIFVVKRYRFPVRRMNSSNGDSQSDVRFLTSDEVLDFTLDKDYDEL